MGHQEGVGGTVRNVIEAIAIRVRIDSYYATNPNNCHPDWWYNLPFNNRFNAVLFSELGPRALGRKEVANRDGLGYTLLLSHKAMEPRYYQEIPPYYYQPPYATTLHAPPFDTSRPEPVFDRPYDDWIYGYVGGGMAGGRVNFHDQARFPYRLLPDSNEPYRMLPPLNSGRVYMEQWSGDCELFNTALYGHTSPHVASSPCLFADGTVRSLRYTKRFNQKGIPSKPYGPPYDEYDYWVLDPEDPEVLVLHRLWTWNDGQPHLDGLYAD